MPYDKPASGLAAERIALYCGYLLLLASLGTAVYRIAFLRRAIHAEATIVGYVQNPPGRGYARSGARDSGFRAVFVYRTEDGRRVQVTSPNSAVDHVPLRPAGSPIAVVYDPADPARARPNTWSALWAATTVLAVLGFSLFAARFAFLRSKGRT